MISVTFDDKQFVKDLQNITNYGIGFMDGIQSNKQVMFSNVGKIIKETLFDFIDSMARTDPKRLHHVYEWYMTGSPNARLYKLHYRTLKSGIKFSYEFSQSRSLKNGSYVPFHNKAKVMEDGTPVTITPTGNKPLVFTQGNETVFTKKPVVVQNPGGTSTDGAFEDTIKIFFGQYMSQLFLDASGIKRDFMNISEFSKNFASGKNGGHSVGLSAGTNWISKVGVR
jgi:hypothetical protein